ncbi:MAG: protein kinase [Gemmatimonadales bacterium]|nr:protein kinase [Gemmatimonadales bacterium]
MSDDTMERLAAAIGEQYRIERVLGRGGMATVYLAEDIRHEREVAIKVLHPDLAASIGGERFQREIRVAGKLQHPHILGMYDSNVADGLFYYVMPFVVGESLRDKIDREGQLTIDEAIGITVEVAGALGYAHAQGVIHRDIKPENILLSGGHALVADFGIARAADEQAQKLTQTGMALGTPTYMAPEQGMGEKVGNTADIYALGCVLYEMLSGEPPFTGKTASGIFAKHVMEQVPSVRIVRSSVPEDVEASIYAAMGKSPADRPQTCDAFVEMLVGAPLGHTTMRMATMRHTTARRVPGMATQQVAVAPRRRWPLIAGVAVALAIAGVAAWKFLPSGRPAATATPGGLDPRQIAVLYFDDLSPDRSLAYLTDGLTEALITELGRVEGLSVISAGGVGSFRGSELGVDSIARALQAGTVVRGSIEPVGDKLQVTVRLLDGTGADFERKALPPQANDPLAIRDSTAVAVAALIRSRLGDEIKLQTQRGGTRNVDAWSTYQRAEQRRRAFEAAATAGDTATRNAEFAAADSLFAAVTELDRSWSAPVIGRAALAYRRSRIGGMDPLVAKEWIERGIEHANRAVTLDPNNGDAFEIRGNLKYWRWLLGLEPEQTRATALIKDAQSDLEASTRLPGNHAGAYASLSHLYYNVDGKTATDVNIAASSAYSADAFMANAEVVLSRLFLSSYDLANFAQADSWCAELRRRFPASLNAPRCELFLLTTTAREPDVMRAWRLVDSVVALTPPARRPFQTLNARMLAAAVLARAKLADSAKAVMRTSIGDPSIDPARDLAQFAAFVALSLGDTVEAFNQLKTFLAASPGRKSSLAQDPGWWFRPVMNNPEWRRVVGSPK